MTTSEIGLAGVKRVVVSRRAPDDARTITSSTSVFQLWQSGHLPSHFADSAPHSWHTNLVWVLAILPYPVSSCTDRSFHVSIPEDYIRRGSQLLTRISA